MHEREGLRRRLRHWLAPAAAFVACGGFVYRRLLTGELLDGRDLSRLDIPNASFLRDQILRGDLPFWIPYLHLGQPFLAVPETQALYPLRWLVFLVSPEAAITLEHLLSLAILAGGTVWAARRIGASRRAATTSALAFSFGAMVTSLSVEQNVVAALSWTGFAIVAGLSIPRRRGRATAGLAASLALSWLAGAPEITACQTGLALGAAVFASRGSSARSRIRAAALSLTGGLLGFGVAAPVTFPAFALGQRLAPLSPPEALQWSSSGIDLLSILWPAVNLPPRDYYGEQHLVPLLFFGTLLGTAAVFGLLRRGRLSWVLGGTIALLVLLSLGKSFTPAAWLLTHTPGLRTFRYPVKYLVVAEWLLALAAARGLDRFAALGRRLRKRLRFVAVAAGGLALLGVAGALALPHLRSGAPPGLALALLWLGLAVVLLGALPGTPAERGVRASRLLAILTLLEALALVSLPQSTGRVELAGDGSLIAAMQAEGWSRATIEEPLSPDELLVVAPSLARQALSGRCLPFLRNRFVEQGLSSIDADGPLDDSRLGAGWAELDGSRPFRDLVGVGWVATLPPPPQSDLAQWASCDQAPPDRRLSIYRSTTGLPRAFLVHEARTFADTADAVRWLSDPAEPFRHAALTRVPVTLAPCDGQEVAVAAVDHPNKLAFEIAACGPSLLVVNEAYDPDWTGTLDGSEAPVIAADLFLQAVAVPAGIHRVVLRYRPPTFRWGLIAAVASAAALLVLSRKRRASSAAPCGA